MKYYFVEYEENPLIRQKYFAKTVLKIIQATQKEANMRNKRLFSAILSFSLVLGAVSGATTVEKISFAKTKKEGSRAVCCERRKMSYPRTDKLQKETSEVLENAKKEQAFLAQKIYETQFQNGAYVPGVDNTDGLYSVFSLVQSGFQAEDFYDAVVAKVKKQLTTMNTAGKVELPDLMTEMTMEEYFAGKYSAINVSKIVLCMSAFGQDVTNFAGINLIEKLCARSLFDASNPTTVSRECMILMALYSNDYAVPEGEAYVTKDELVTNIVNDIDAQIETAKSWDSYDSVAMVIQPLAAYLDETDKTQQSLAVWEECEKALNILNEKQAEDGSYICYGASNPWSLSQVMVTMGMFGIHPLENETSAFIKNGKNVLHAADMFVDVENGTVDSQLIGGEYAYQPEQLLRGYTAAIGICEGAGNVFDTKVPKYIAKEIQAENSKLMVPSIKKITSPKKKTLKVRFTKVTGAKKYVVEVSTNKKFKKITKKVTTKSNNVTIKKLTSKKKYYVRVKAVSGKNTSDYSKTVEKTVK